MHRKTLQYFLMGMLALSAVGLYAQKKKPIHERSFEEIIRDYLFIADFTVKSPDRNISDELFWKYPFRLSKIHFPIKFEFDDFDKEMPPTRGDGMVLQHLNRGRLFFQEGEYDKARKVWLAARARYGSNYPAHRRNDYFVALSFLKIAKKKHDEKYHDWFDANVKSRLSNAATFLSYAFVVKADLEDDLLEYVQPKQIYNLAAIYFRYGRYAGAYGAAERGLDYLRKSGRTEYRSELQRMLAEAHIQNNDYLSAIKELDSALRQNPSKQSAASIFRRVGDIYFDLNNYELAEENYGIANRIDSERDSIDPSAFVLRGESLFWLGKFSEAQKMFAYALEFQEGKGDGPVLDKELLGYAKLRIADAYLARKQLEKAKLAYFEASQEMRGTEVGRVAKIRSACMELPSYDGKNVGHARNLLEEFKKGGDFPPQARELAWACHVGSFAQRERSPEMVERVRDFYQQYPNSRFLQSLVEPVREVRASKLAEYFNKGELFNAMSYYEKNKELLFKNLDVKSQAQLFEAYADAFQSEKAAKFFEAYAKRSTSDMAMLRLVTIASEMHSRTNAKRWKGEVDKYRKRLAKRKWTFPMSDLARGYLGRLSMTKNPDKHSLWTYRVWSSWAAGNDKLICESLYPAMTKLYRQSGKQAQSANILQDDIRKLVDGMLPGLLRSDDTCGISLLELEVQILKDKPSDLAIRYLQRTDWPMSEELAGLFWDVAERNLKARQVQPARQLWSVIVDKAPSNSPKVAFAKSRLELRATEFERLWAE